MALVIPQPDYSTVTEQPAQKATRSQMAMLCTRYGWAARQTEHKDVLEVACGSGMGLGWLARTAQSVEAGDLDPVNCRLAQGTYAGHPKIRVQTMDAMNLPFEDESFDLVLLFEALYYLADVERFFRQARRVLRTGGKLLLATVNPEWRGFNPSPFSSRYHSAAELKAALLACGFEPHSMAGFPERRNWISGVRGVAVAFGWIPKTMAGKALLKRLFYGRLESIPSQLVPGEIRPEAMTALREDLDLRNYRALYTEAAKNSA